MKPTEMMPSENGMRIECGVYADDPPRGTPMVYIACLGCYNEGRLTGSWVDADRLEERWDYAEEHDRQDRVGHFNKCSRPFHDEWAIHDYDGVPNLGEHPDIPYLLRVMEAVEEHGEPFLEWFNLDPHNKSHHDDLGESFQDAYAGKWDSKEEFAEDFAESCGYIDSTSTNPLWRYVDFEWFWNAELRYSHDYSNGHVFRSDV